MKNWNFILLCLGITCMQFGSIRGISEKDRSTLIGTLFPHVLECSSKFDIGADISKLLDDPTNLEDVNPCLVACVMKRLKLMDDKGLYDEHKGKKISKKLFPSDDDQKNLNELAETCASVNEKEVSDGDKGCERAKLLMDCFMPHKELFLGTKKTSS